MSEANKTVARNQWEGINSRDLDKALELYADDVVHHSKHGDTGKEVSRSSVTPM